MIFSLQSILFFLFEIATSAATVTYSEIITFIEKKPNVVVNFKSITTSQNETLTLSGKHLIFARGSSSNKFSTISVFVSFFSKSTFLLNTEETYYIYQNLTAPAASVDAQESSQTDRKCVCM